jgi:hypothetical protein
MTWNQFQRACYEVRQGEVPLSENAEIAKKCLDIHLAGIHWFTFKGQNRLAWQSYKNKSYVS